MKIFLVHYPTRDLVSFPDRFFLFLFVVAPPQIKTEKSGLGTRLLGTCEKAKIFNICCFGSNST